MRIEALTESSCIVWFADHVDAEVLARVRQAADAIGEGLGEGVLDVVPAHASVHVQTDPTRLPIADCLARLEKLLAALKAPDVLLSRRTFEIPAYYGADAAPDLRMVAQHAGINESDVAALHTSVSYRVYAIGFAPGFCFLGETDARLDIPRRTTPRRRVPAGSIAIADRQTAVYPLDTPGGWHLIGRTRVDMLALCTEEQHPLRVGDEVRFVAIDRKTFLDAGGML